MAADAPAYLDAEAVHRLAPFGPLVEALREAHLRPPPAAERLLMSQPNGAGQDDHFLVWPAWRPGAAFGAKLVSVFPGNAAQGRPAIDGIYALFDGRDGSPACIIDGPALTFRKTAADSALAASLLARPDARRLAMLGAGGQAIWQARALAAVRPLAEAAIWNRTPDKAERLAASLRREGLAATATDDPRAAVEGADIVSCVTSATEPVLQGAWLSPGAHVDLVGSYTPAMREADDEAVARARVFVDTRRFTLADCGDIAQPLASGAIAPSHVLGDLFELAQGAVPGRLAPHDVTLFKNAGGGHLDLICAEFLFARLRAERLDPPG
ncbi:bifunctional Delta(1)-pyrroline-2-carboxylate/Delta(1)-piperideine-2-carboxylate reductase [Alsobacter sp. SYSU BS001988]|jgi:ornithine cyclodeaminase